MNELHPNCKLWIYSDSRDGVFGDGKLRLLQEIDRQGSLTEAAVALGISYRKAWGDIKKAEECMNLSLVEKTRGGKGGGQTVLTVHGRKLVVLFDRFRNNLTQHIEREFEQFMGDMKQ